MQKYKKKAGAVYIQYSKYYGFMPPKMETIILKKTTDFYKCTVYYC